MAVITAQQPDGEIALGIQLKHAARRAVSNATTSGYATETPEWAAEFEHELQDAVAARLVGLWATKVDAEIRLGGAGAQRFRDEIAQVENVMENEVKVGDERHTPQYSFATTSARCDGARLNHCLGIPEQAACLQDLPAAVAADGVMPNRCQPSHLQELRGHRRTRPDMDRRGTGPPPQARRPQDGPAQPRATADQNSQKSSRITRRFPDD